MLSHPLRPDQAAHELPVQATWMTVVDIFHARFGVQLGFLQSPRHGLVFTPAPVVIHQEPKAFLKTEAGGAGIFHLPAIGVGHTVEVQRVQLLHSLLVQHPPTPSACLALSP